MSIHAPHPDTHTAGLADNCLRCAEHAKDLTSLDSENLRALKYRTLLWNGQEGPEQRAARPRSNTEGQAMVNLWRVIVLAERLERL